MAVITKIEDNQVMLSNKRVLKFRGGNHTLSSGIAPAASTPGMPGQMPGANYDAEVSTMMGANGVPVYVEPQPAQFR
jgi:hypothetical protein